MTIAALEKLDPESAVWLPQETRQRYAMSRDEALRQIEPTARAALRASLDDGPSAELADLVRDPRCDDGSTCAVVATSLPYPNDLMYTCVDAQLVADQKAAAAAAAASDDGDSVVHFHFVFLVKINRMLERVAK